MNTVEHLSYQHKVVKSALWFETSLYLLKEITMFLEKKDSNTGECNGWSWVTDLAFVVNVTGHLNNRNKEPQGDDKLIAEMHGDVKASKWNFGCGKTNYNCIIFFFAFHAWSLLTLLILSVFKNVLSTFFCCERNLAKCSRTAELWKQKFYYLLYI